MRFWLSYTSIYPFKQTNHIGPTYFKTAGQWETSASCSYKQQDSSWVERASWLLHISFWLEAAYVFLRTSHFFSLSSSSPIKHQHIMVTPTHQPGESRSESSRSTGTSSLGSIGGTQHQCRDQLGHRDSANAATENLTQDADFQIVHTTGSRKNKKQHAFGCEYIHIVVNGHQLIV